MHKRKRIIGYLTTTAISVSLISWSFVTQAQHEAQDHGPETGSIVGRVVNAEGQPIAKARVTASLVEAKSRVESLTETDEDGKFTIKDLAPGTYTLRVANEEEGYPPTDSEFYTDYSIIVPQVGVYGNRVTRDVLVQAGQKRAWLAGRVVDSVTGEPINDAIITFRRADNPKIFFSTGSNQTRVKGGFKLLAPNFPFTVTVSAPGYDDWHPETNGPQKLAGTLQLFSGETRELTVSLRPAK